MARRDDKQSAKDHSDQGGISEEDRQRLVLFMVETTTIKVNLRLYEAAVKNANAEGRMITEIAENGLTQYIKAARRRAVRRELAGQFELFPELAPPSTILSGVPRTKLPRVLLPKKPRRTKAPEDWTTFDDFLATVERGKDGESK